MSTKSFTEAGYPYNGRDTNPCNSANGTGPNSYSYEYIKANNLRALQDAINTQPIAVNLASSSLAFRSYASGIFNDYSCGVENDHYVTAVGYGTDTTNGMSYFILKNSWGTNWGEQGYMRIASLSGVGLCGMLKHPSYVTVQ